MASFRPASALSASVYILQWGLPSDRLPSNVPTSVGTANEQHGALLAPRSTLRKPNASPPRKCITSFSFFLCVSMRSCLTDFKPRRHCITRQYGVQAHPKPDSCMYEHTSNRRSSLGSAACLLGPCTHRSYRAIYKSTHLFPIPCIGALG